MTDLHPDIIKLLNDQLNAERAASAVYYAAGNYLNAKNAPNGAQWCFKESEEEMTHCKKFCDHLLLHNVQPKLTALPEPKNDFANYLEIFEIALKYEREYNILIKKIFAAAREKNQYDTEIFLQFFIKHQVEAVTELETFLERAKGSECMTTQHLDSHFGVLMG